MKMPLSGERLRERRKFLNMSQEDLAHRLGTDQKQISQYENGKGNPTAETLVALARELSASTDYLLGLVDEPTQSIKNEELAPKEREAIMAWRRGDREGAAVIILTDKRASA